MADRPRAIVHHPASEYHPIVTPPEGATAEVRALCGVIVARVTTSPESEHEWRAIVRAAERIARIGRGITR